MSHGNEPFCGNVIFMFFVLSLLNALSGRFESLVHSCVNSFPCVVFAKNQSMPMHIAISLVGFWAPLRMNSLEVFRNLHGIAESICNSNVISCNSSWFFIEYQIFWIKVINSSQLTCICKASALILSSAVFLVAALSSTCATRNSGQMFSGLDVPWIFVNLTPDHISLRWSSIQHGELGEAGLWP